MKKILKWLDDNFEMYLSIILMSAMTIILFIQVIARRVFNNSLTWSEEVARYIFIWLIYFGISYGAKIMKHIKIEAFLGVYPKKVRPYIEILGDVIFFAFGIFIIFTSWEWAQREIMLQEKSPAVHLPMWIVYIAPAVGYTCTCIREIQTIVHRVKLIRAHINDNVNLGGENG
jgi:TRAP-type C4-dicarboxylate transport system permease small subunit